MKKQFLIFAVVVVVSYVLVLLGSRHTPPPASGQPTQAITVGVFLNELAAPIWIAEDQGYFTDNGLAVTVKGYDSGVTPLRDLLAGTVDMATAAEFVFVSHAFYNDNLRVLGIFDEVDAIKLVVRADRGIAQPSDLRGKKIGVVRNSESEFFLGRWLTFNSLSPDDIQLVDLVPSAIVEAVTAGDVDAAMIWESYGFTIKQRLGADVVSWSGQSGQNAYLLLVGSEQLVRTRPAVVERFLRALVQAETFAATHSDEAQTIVAHRLNVERSYIRYAWPGHSFGLWLDQALLLAMEDEARWLMGRNVTQTVTAPNYLNLIYFDGLAAIRPEAITIIR